MEMLSSCVIDQKPVAAGLSGSAVSSRVEKTGSPSTRGTHPQTIVPARSIRALTWQLPIGQRSRLRCMIHLCSCILRMTAGGLQGGLMGCQAALEAFAFERHFGTAARQRAGIFFL